MNERIWWIISIGGYGKYAFYASKDEAEENRIAKSEWEGQGGRKSKANYNKPGDVALVEQSRNSYLRSIHHGTNGIETLPPPLEDKKELAMSKGRSNFKDIGKRITYKPEKIETLDNGWFLVKIKEGEEVVEEHLFSSLKRASNFVTIIGLV